VGAAWQSCDPQAPLKQLCGGRLRCQSWEGAFTRRWEGNMTVARVTEISSTSDKSFEDAVNKGIARATKTLRGVSGAWVKEHKVAIRKDKIVNYQVNMMVTFVLED
jgi:dodecin